MTELPLTTIGQVEEVTFLDQDAQAIPARIDTGAKTSAVWATNIVEKNRALHFVLFDSLSPFYTGKIINTVNYSTKSVTSSNGQSEERYAVKLRILIGGKKIRATFTLADRSQQVYPILVGRNVLRGKFIVDVKQGKPLIQAERKRTQQLRQRLLKRKEK